MGKDKADIGGFSSNWGRLSPGGAQDGITEYLVVATAENALARGPAKVRGREPSGWNHDDSGAQSPERKLGSGGRVGFWGFGVPGVGIIGCSIRRVLNLGARETEAYNLARPLFCLC